MEEMISIAAHQIRAPLGPLLLQVQLLQRAYEEGSSLLSPESVQRILARTAEQIRCINRLVDNLLASTRIAAGHLDLREEEVDLLALAEEVVGRRAHEAAQLGYSVRVEGKKVVGRWDPVL